MLSFIQSLPTDWCAAFWGFVAGLALLVGAAIGYYATVGTKVIAAIMAFGAGVLVSALAFDLMDDAYAKGGFTSAIVGLVGGAVIYVGANALLERRGAHHRKRSGQQQS